MLELKNVCVQADDFRLEDVSFVIPSGSCGVLMGPSGAGKTTLMEAICGLRPVHSGSIVLHGESIQRLRPAERRVGWVPQDTMLFPHLSVREQVAFGPEVLGWAVEDIRSRVEHLATSLGIGHLLDRGPRGLSGGEAKRVAIGRALAGRPALLCLDEALTGLDDDTHVAVMDVIQRVVREEEVTTLVITHRRDEAEALGDQIVSMRAGRLVD